MYWCTRWVAVALVVAACTGPASTVPERPSVQERPTVSTSAGSVPVSSTYPVPDFGGEVPEEYPFVLDCMEWYGFPGEVDPVTGEGLVFDYAPEATGEFMAAITDCSNAWRRLAGLRTEPPDRDELATMYDRFLEVQECLVANGFPVEDPPTREVFVETESPWHPYNALYKGGVDTEVLEAAEAACPAE